MRIPHQPFARLLSSFLWLGVALSAHAATLAPLTVAVSTAPKTLNPAIATDTAAARLLQLTHPALLQWNAAFQPTGFVATGCTQPSLTVATCTLPENQTFTDGTPLTAAAVAAWFRQLQANPRSPFSGQLKGVSITTPQAGQVAFQLPSPTLGFLATLTEIPLANPASPSVGMGPYRLQSMDAQGNATLATKKAGLPPTLTFTAVADATTRMLKLKKGEVDMAMNDLSPQLLQWAQGQGFNVVSAPADSYTYLGLNFNNPVLANPLVRKAMAMAINRPAIRQHLLNDMAQPAGSLMPPGSPAAWQAPEEAFDPFTAEDLLDQANLLRGPNNMRFTVTLLTSTDPFSQRVSQVLQAELRGVGINVELRPTEWASFYGSVKKGSFDMVMLAWTGELQPTFYYHLFNSAQVPPAGFNRGHVNNPEIDRLTAAVMNATTEAQQNAAAIALQQYLAKFLPYIPLYRRDDVLVTAPGITGCKLSAGTGYKGLLSCRKP